MCRNEISKVVFSVRTNTNHFLDTIKGVACICVVFIHIHFPGVLGDVVARLSNFAVPIFFMTSGFFSFSYDRCWKNKVLKRRAKRILLMAFWTTLLYTCITKGAVFIKNGCTLGGI